MIQTTKYGMLAHAERRHERRVTVSEDAIGAVVGAGAVRRQTRLLADGFMS